MSKTDNTQPYLLQAADRTRFGEVYHFCGHSDRSCDYHEGINLHVFRTGKFGFCCTRSVRHFGGVNNFGAAGKAERKKLRRSVRNRDRAAFNAVRASGDYEDFDLLPVYGDRRCLAWLVD